MHPTPPLKVACVTALALALSLGACGGDEIPERSSDSTEVPATTSEISPVVDEPQDLEGEGGFGGGGEGEGEGDIPLYDATNDRTETYEGVPEPCLLLTPRLVNEVHGAFDLQQAVSGPVCVYIQDDPLFEVSLGSFPPSYCDDILEGVEAQGIPVDDEPFDGGIISWLSPRPEQRSALIYEGEWCYHLRSSFVHQDRPSMSIYVDEILAALG